MENSKCTTPDKTGEGRKPRKEALGLRLGLEVLEPIQFGVSTTPPEPTTTGEGSKRRQMSGKQEKSAKQEKSSGIQASSSMGCKGTGVLTLNTNKAGMEGLPLGEINKIINDASCGSKYMAFHIRNQALLEEKVEKMRNARKTISQSLIDSSTVQVDARLKQLLGQTEWKKNVIVHLDMDAFFAEVEMKDNENLRSQPVAVGTHSMLSTANYMARTKGVRSGMPGYIAKKLCPELVIVEPRMGRYEAVSDEIGEIVKEYDPSAVMVMDEVKLDITQALRDLGMMDPTVLVASIRQKIFEKTSLTASAGIAPNGLLAKICSNMNKPNGQYYLEPNFAAITAFLGNLQVRKVSGIGPKTEALLTGALGIETVGKLYANRGLVKILFTPCLANFLTAASVGLGEPRLEESDVENERKSIGVERTFTATGDYKDINDICLHLYERLISALKSHNLQGTSLTIKMKSSDFDTTTKTFPLRNVTSPYSEVVNNTIKCFKDLKYSQKYPNDFKIRLLGLRMSQLKVITSENDNLRAVDPPFRRKFQQNLIEMMKKFERRQHVAYECPICFTNIEKGMGKQFRAHVKECVEALDAQDEASENTVNPNGSTPEKSDATRILFPKSGVKIHEPFSQNKVPNRAVGAKPPSGRRGNPTLALFRQLPLGAFFNIHPVIPRRVRKCETATSSSAPPTLADPLLPSTRSSVTNIPLQESSAGLRKRKREEEESQPSSLTQVSKFRDYFRK